MGVLRRPIITLILRVIAIALVGASALLGIQRAQVGNTWFDVFDEAAHFDYLLKLSDGSIPSWGSVYEQETLLIASCLGSPLVPSVPDCRITERPPSMSPPQGYNYEAQQPPLGYLVYLPGIWLSEGAAPAARLGLVRDIGGTVQLVLACALLLGLASQLRLGFWRTAVLSAVVLLAPTTVHAFSTVSNDPATMIAALVFAALLLLGRRFSPRVALLIGLAAGLILGATKAYLVLLPLGALAALVVLNVVIKNRNVAALRGLLRRSDALFLLAASGAALLLAVGFTVVQSVRGTVPSGVVLSALMGFSMSDAVNPNTVVSSVANLSNQWLGATNGLITSPQLFVVLNGVLLVLIGVAFARRPAQATVSSRFFATTWVIIILVFSIAWPVLLHFQGNFDFDTPARYGLMVLPLAALAVTEGIGRRSGARTAALRAETSGLTRRLP